MNPGIVKVYELLNSAWVQVGNDITVLLTLPVQLKSLVGHYQSMQQEIEL